MMGYCLLFSALDLTTLSNDDIELIAKEHYAFQEPEIVFKSSNRIEVRDRSSEDILYIESEFKPHLLYFNKKNILSYSLYRK